MLVLFRDFDPVHLKDPCGYNKIGYITSSKEFLIFEKHFSIIKTSINHLERLKHEFRPLPELLDSSPVDRYFLSNYLNSQIFHIGLRKIMQIDQTFFDYPIRLPILDLISEDVRMKRYDKLIKSCRSCDLINIVDAESIISRLITWADDGIWSHTGIISSVGTIYEATTKGVVETPFSHYANNRFRMGLYRNISPSFNPELAEMFARSQLGARYNYLGAAKLGLRMLLKLPRPKPSPNDLCYPDFIRLVCYI